MTTKETETTTTQPRIYVASLADYNAGRLLGRWIDANQAADQLHAEILEMLGESRELVAEDWAIHDYEGFGGLNLSEFEDIDRIAAVAEGLAKHGPIFAELAAHFGGLCGLEEACRYIEDGYRGEDENLADYVEQLLDDCYGDILKGLPDFIRYHIDFDGIAQDMEMNGDIFTIEIGRHVHVFDSNL